MKKKYIALSLACALVLSVQVTAKAEDITNAAELNQPVSINNIQSKKILITNVSSSVNEITPGQIFELKFKLENNSNNKLENVSLKIAGVEGKNLLTGFSPVGTTNEIYGGTINKKGSKELSIKLISDPSLKVGLYNFIVSVTFNSPGKPQEEISKIIGVVIKNTPKLIITSLDINDNKIYSNFINAGKGPLSNVLINFKVNDKTYSKYYGTLDSEVEDSFEENIEPVSSDTKGVLEISYIDEMGVEGKVTKEIDIKSSETQKTAVSSKEENKNSFFSFIKKLFGIGG